MNWGWLVEKRIQRAQERGDFEGLPGRGKPLPLPEENPFEGTWRLAFHLLKNADLLPTWIELDKEARARRAETIVALRPLDAGSEGMGPSPNPSSNLMTKVKRTNQLIRARNLVVPDGLPPLAPIRSEEEPGVE